jgi:hypothetical protein
LAIWTHDELVQTDGEAAAAKWLWSKTKVPYQLAIVAYQFGRYDILWEPLEDPARPTKNDQIELLRAAALLMEHSTDTEKRDRSLRYFESRPRKDWAILGLFLLGRATEAELFAEARNPQSRTNIAWLMGVRAVGERRYEEASDWFSVAVDTDQPHAPPTGFSWETLNRWIRAWEPLSDLANEKPPRPAAASAAVGSLVN